MREYFTLAVVYVAVTLLGLGAVLWVLVSSALKGGGW